jgi:hypothetical protein
MRIDVRNEGDSSITLKSSPSTPPVIIPPSASRKVPSSVFESERLCIEHGAAGEWCYTNTLPWLMDVYKATREDQHVIIAVTSEGELVVVSPVYENTRPPSLRPIAQ